MAKRKKRKKRKNKTGLLIWGSLVFLLGFSLYVAYKLIHIPYPEKKLSVPVYEEKIPFIEDKIKKVDITFLKVAKKVRLPLKNIKFKAVQLKIYRKDLYHYQKIKITISKKQKAVFLSCLINSLKELGPWVKVKKNTTDEVCIKINGIITHTIYFVEKLPRYIPRKGKILFIIDDMGRSIYKAKRLYEIMGNRIIFSILPFAPHTKEVVAFAKKNKINFLLHLPLEPKGYPEINPGKGALTVNMSEAQIRKTFLKDLSKVPGAIGVNNHMGSKFTENIKAMKCLLKIISEKGLFFLDSLTTPYSVTKKIASDIKHLKVYFRDIFLDNQKDESYVYLQIKKAMDLTRTKKMVIAIGHPYDETILGLACWVRSNQFRVALGKF